MPYSSLLLIVLSACLSAAGLAMGAEPGATVPPGVAVVELFTSEGCSSCPAADDALAVEAAAARPGVILLAYHIDYWDRLGWKDPYASAAASSRQYAYAKGSGGRVYTPQAMVNGRVDVVGSDTKALQEAIARELMRPSTARITINAAWAGKTCTVACTIAVPGGKPDAATVPASATLTVALVEDALTDVVTRGENAGRTLAHQRVVREARSVPTAGAIAPIVFTLPDASIPQRMRVVAYVQDAKRGVVGAAESEWTDDHKK